jgi:hypothetical protein
MIIVIAVRPEDETEENGTWIQSERLILFIIELSLTFSKYIASDINIKQNNPSHGFYNIAK